MPDVLHAENISNLNEMFYSKWFDPSGDRRPKIVA